MSESENLLEVRDLRKSFSVPNAGKKRLQALDGINLDLPRGQTLGLWSGPTRAPWHSTASTRSACAARTC